MTGSDPRRVVPRRAAMALEKGQCVRVVRGPLSDCSGHLIKPLRGDWCVQFDCLPDGVYVILPADYLEMESWPPGQDLDTASGNSR
jgi:hypothetical protein